MTVAVGRVTPAEKTKHEVNNLFFMAGVTRPILFSRIPAQAGIQCLSKWIFLQNI
jgi:hypothetical protein